MQIQPYLFFEGRCDEAIKFYRKALGAKVLSLERYRDNPAPPKGRPGNKVMHARLQIGDTTISVSDGKCSGHPRFKGFSLSLTAPSPANVKRLFEALAKGGDVSCPLTKTFFASRFGMVTDRFGILWIIYVKSRKHSQ